MSDDKATLELDNTKTDYAVMAGRAVSGLVPFAGSFIAELIENVVPNQRFDRLVSYVKMLDHRIEELTADQKETIAQSPEAIDLFEEGGAQAARALSPERLGYIADLVSFGISGDQKDRTEAKRLLHLLRSIDDDQIIILASHLYKNREDDDFQTRHHDILDEPFPHMQSSREELDRSTVFGLARSSLVSLGLLKPYFRKPRRDELPEFDDKTGMIKAMGYEITPLGILILRRLNLADEEDF